jgi:uncharacterized RDD family membrane protein YckC
VTDVRVGVGPRAAAAAIDLIAMVCAAVAVGTVFAFVSSAQADRISAPGGTGDLEGLLGFLGGLAAAFAAALGYSLIEGLTGRSPGKRLLHLVVSRDDGLPATRRQYATRWIAKYSAVILIGAGVITGSELVAMAGRLVGIVSIAGCALALGDHKRALHDFVAGTAVCRLEPRAESRKPRA